VAFWIRNYRWGYPFVSSSSDLFPLCPAHLSFCIPAKATVVSDSADWLQWGEVRRLTAPVGARECRLVTRALQLNQPVPWIVEATLKNPDKRFVIEGWCLGSTVWPTSTRCIRAGMTTKRRSAIPCVRDPSARRWLLPWSAVVDAHDPARKARQRCPPLTRQQPRSAVVNAKSFDFGRPSFF